MTTGISPALGCENVHLKCLDGDNLYHLGLSTKVTNFKKEFGDVRFVCVAGSAHRIEKFAKQLASEAGVKSDLPNLAENGGRYVLYKVGSVLAANHGMGSPSLSILLHELFKLLHYAECQHVTFIRLGTSGGIGVSPGTIVITTEPLNTEFQPFYELRILGKMVKRQAVLSSELGDELFTLAKSLPGPISVVKGKTVCANDFYEEQARLDGAFCKYSEEDKLAYLQKAYDAGVRNFEMECTCLGALCHMAGVHAAVVCTTLLDRMKSDQVAISPDDYARYEQLPSTLVIAYLKKHNALTT